MSSDLMKKLFSIFKSLMTRKVYMECDSIPLSFSAVPLRKMLNRMFVEAGCVLRPERPWGLPTHLQIEPTTLCNLRCALCYVTKGLNRREGQMDRRVFEKLIDEIGDYVFLILFWGWGEPFLNPLAYDMIAYAKNRGIKVISSTNGHVFVDEDQANRLVESGLDAIIFAVDGLSEDTYKQYRRGGDLNTAVSGLKNVVSAKRKLRTSTPMINLRFIVMKHNEHEVPKIKEFAQSLGADLVSLKTLNVHENPDLMMGSGSSFIPESPAYQRFRINPNTMKPVRRRRNPCKDLWNYAFLGCEGRIGMCCEDYSLQETLGDMNKEHFRDIWHGNGYRILRRKFRKDYRSIPRCDVCSSAFEGGAMGTDLIVESYSFQTPD